MVSGASFPCFLQTQGCQHYTHMGRAPSESSLHLQSAQTPYSCSVRLSKCLRGMRENRIVHLIRPSGLPFPPSAMIPPEIAVRVRAELYPSLDGGLVRVCVCVCDSVCVCTHMHMRLLTSALNQLNLPVLLHSSLAR